MLRLGHPLSNQSTLARVGYMHENQAFPRYLTARALLEFYADLSWLPPAVRRTRVPALLEPRRTGGPAREPIARYSKGMVQRASPWLRPCSRSRTCSSWTSRWKVST